MWLHFSNTSEGTVHNNQSIQPSLSIYQLQWLHFKKPITFLLYRNASQLTDSERNTLYWRSVLEMRTSSHSTGSWERNEQRCSPGTITLNWTLEQLQTLQQPRNYTWREFDTILSVGQRQYTQHLAKKGHTPVALTICECISQNFTSGFYKILLNLLSDY